MVTITLSTTSTHNSVSIDGHIIYGTNFSGERLGQQSLRTGDGVLITYDNSGIIIGSGELIIKGVTYAHGEALRTWLYTKAIFQLYSFTIYSPHADCNLGKGKGVDITEAKFAKFNDEGVFVYSAPGVYRINFPYTFNV